MSQKVSCRCDKTRKRGEHRAYRALGRTLITLPLLHSATANTSPIVGNSQLCGSMANWLSYICSWMVNPAESHRHTDCCDNQASVNYDVTKIVSFESHSIAIPSTSLAIACSLPSSRASESICPECRIITKCTEKCHLSALVVSIQLAKCAHGCI